MSKLFKKYLDSNIYIKLIPLLVLYLLVITFWRLPTELAGDEGRYLKFAGNILEGYYSPEYPNIDLRNGPGYPLLITPFVALKLPLFWIRIANGFFLYFSLIITYRTLIIYIRENKALFFTILLGLYFPAYQMLRLIHTESFSFFLIALNCYAFIKYFLNSSFSWKLFLLSSFSIFYLVMVKVIFGYVVIALVIISIFIYYIPSLKETGRKTFLVFSLSFIMCIPYLIYTYSITDIPFYWSNSAGINLYNMSSPYINESGEWKSEIKLKSIEGHKAFIKKIENLHPIEKDREYWKAGKENIKKYPSKYLLNYVANWGRILIQYPMSNEKQTADTLFYIFPAMFIVVCITFSLIIAIKNLKYIPHEIVLLFLLVSIYLFGTSIVSAQSRMFNITLPFWIILIAYIYNRFIFIKVLKS